jgi:WD40 repeat protein
MKKPTAPSMSLHSPAVASPASGHTEPHRSSSSENPQDILLRLLNPPKPSSAEGSKSTPEMTRTARLGQSFESSSMTPEHSRLTSPMRVFGSPQPGEDTSFDAPAVASQGKPTFAFSNPFEQLPKSSKPADSTLPPTILSSALADTERMPPNGADFSSKARKLGSKSDAPTTQSESVADAVGNVAKDVKKEIDAALEQAATSQNASPPVQAGASMDTVQKEVEEAVVKSAVDIKEALGDADTRQELEEAVSKPVVQALEQVADEIAQENVADSWESADAEESSAKGNEETVRVYNFPMKPFTSIEIVKLHEPPNSIRSDIVLDIARFKKEFDQIDRQLVCASKTVIVHALNKQGGFRVIHQENGQHQTLFNASKERIFNLSICTPAHGSNEVDQETILGTGVNGSVYWTSLPTDAYVGAQTDQDLERFGFIFPPTPASDDNTSGGQLKTRAKTSSRHPEFFAVGRGKSIHLIYGKIAKLPDYTDPKTVTCDTEKYLKDRCLKIATGKAGKDFAFSADDTVIASLDKAGRMRFWDIRQMIDPSYDSSPGPMEPVLVKTPIMTLQITSANDKSWPTSLLFLDKDRPLSKGIALRYMVIGQKQNHTLQLWDLGLGKAVQELNLPHENESDAICSVAYHAKSGVMVVGHPTRNSIYFVHISAPRYNLGVMSQAKYLSLLAERSSQIPKPESTAIMSGIREYSFASKGQLRSLHLLDEPAILNEGQPPGDRPLFELYVMHSRGVTALSVKKADLGWADDYRVKNPVDNSEETGAISVNQLRPAQPVTEPSTNGEQRPASTAPSHATRDTRRDVLGSSRTTSQNPEAAMRASTLAKVESKQDAERAAILNGPEKADKRKKKKANETQSQSSSTSLRNTAVSAILSPAPASYAQAAQRSKSPELNAQADESMALIPALQADANGTDIPNWARQLINQTTASASPAQIDDTIIRRTANEISTEFSKTLNDRLGELYRRFDEDKRVQDATAAAKQDAVLRLVSSTLTDNVEKTLSRIIGENINKVVLPGLIEATIGSLDRQVTEVLQKSTVDAVTTQLKSALQPAVMKSLQDSQAIRGMYDAISKKITSHLDGHFRDSIMPVLTAMQGKMQQQKSGDLDRRMTEMLHQVQQQRHKDAAEITRLTNMVGDLTSLVQTMHVRQSEILQRLSKQQSSNQSGIEEVEKIAEERAPPHRDAELEAIHELMSNGKFEDGTVKVGISLYSVHHTVLARTDKLSSGFNLRDRMSYSTCILFK